MLPLPTGRGLGADSATSRFHGLNRTNNQKLLLRLLRHSPMIPHKSPGSSTSGRQTAANQISPKFDMRLEISQSQCHAFITVPATSFRRLHENRDLNI